MKKIIYLIVFLVLISLVSASELGEELVTCGDFSCSDEWVDLPTCFLQNEWCWVSFGGYTQHRASGSELRTNFSQSISVQENKIYNITIIIDLSTIKVFLGSNELNIYLGDTKENIFTDFSPIVDTYFSFLISPTTSNGLFVEGIGNDGGIVGIESISVKEIIEPPTVFIRHNNEEILIPYTLFERKENDDWVINLPKVLFRRFKRWLSG